MARAVWGARAANTLTDAVTLALFESGTDDIFAAFRRRRHDSTVALAASFIS
jgi:hypothetical protein